MELNRQGKDFIQDYYNRVQDYCNRGERLNATLNTTWGRWGVIANGQGKGVSGK